MFPAKPENSIDILGIMSGTSLDGLDLSLVNFEKHLNSWTYKVTCAETINYSTDIKSKLSSAHLLSAEEITKLDFWYGQYIGIKAKDFLKRNEVHADYIASHGHTVFHNPSSGYTLQIGKGAAIAAISGIPCISDFRSGDVCRNGQGAPLVPIGDKLLFSKYQACLNLGGIANISFDNQLSKRVAFDIVPCNMILNYLAKQAGVEFDNSGELGKKGKIDTNLLSQLNSLEYFNHNEPKSIGREWFEQNILPPLENATLLLPDKLRTSYEFISAQIGKTVRENNLATTLVTGGGAHNSFLIDLIKETSKTVIIVPDKKTVDYKEAIIFAFLGVLFLYKEKGAISSVTGALEDSVAGSLYY